MIKIEETELVLPENKDLVPIAKKGNMLYCAKTESIHSFHIGYSELFNKASKINVAENKMALIMASMKLYASGHINIEYAASKIISAAQNIGPLNETDVKYLFNQYDLL